MKFILKRTLPLVIFLFLHSCKVRPCNDLKKPSTSTQIAGVQNIAPPTSIRPESAAETLIWKGKIATFRIRWTTQDLYVDSSAGTERLWRPFIERGFEDFKVVSLKTRSHRSQALENCTYERHLTVLSVVSTLVSFEDEYADYCGGAHPSEDVRFTTVDISKPGSISYVHEGSTPLLKIDMANNPSRTVKLTDYFSEHEIFDALLADKLIKETLQTFEVRFVPNNLSQLLEILAKHEYALGDSGLALSPDFLTRFAFHHLIGNRVSVRISLSSASSANQAEREQIGLLLLTPKALASPLRSSATRREGFLMKDENVISRGSATVYSFP